MALEKGSPAWIDRIHGISVDPNLITEAAERHSAEVLMTNNLLHREYGQSPSGDDRR